ncbi:Rieske 2Fe-2S domain-containing protein [Asticcacaulis sp. EMRT-3]|uniref:Rieske (2Fe-2S) protein n=1 Tax=Asticcacaulis sp. EMRT-3 TaxID=3040349 RepID=UPI0024AF09F2|nr:Rieske 2Fe-2S domain-containing protein [Asticcacaulis sp. EMRT-3]MDI7773929.1 Rieske 2Fe-2S domain-containing protein [Asticcacaulis sp. EMRT-3]
MSDRGESPPRRALATPAGLKLASPDEVAPDTARHFSLAVEDGLFQGFVVHKEGGFYGFVDLCPHTMLSLTESPADDYLTPQADLITCARHGALFRITSGQCIAGPCAGRALIPWPVRVENDDLVTADVIK